VRIVSFVPLGRIIWGSLEETALLLNLLRGPICTFQCPRIVSLYEDENHNSSRVTPLHQWRPLQNVGAELCIISPTADVQRKLAADVGDGGAKWVNCQVCVCVCVCALCGSL